MESISKKIQSNIVAQSDNTKATLEKMNVEIAPQTARRRLFDLLRLVDFSNSSQEFKDECSVAVFWAAELIRD